MDLDTVTQTQSSGAVKEPSECDCGETPHESWCFHGSDDDDDPKECQRKRKRNEPIKQAIKKRRTKEDSKVDSEPSTTTKVKEKKKPTEPRTVVVQLLPSPRSSASGSFVADSNQQPPPKWKTEAIPTKVFTVCAGRVSASGKHDVFHPTGEKEVPFPADIKVNRKQKTSVEAVEEIKKCLQEGRTSRAYSRSNEWRCGPMELILAFGRTVEDDLAYVPVYEQQQEEIRLQKEQVKRRDETVSQIQQMIQTDHLSGACVPDRIEDVATAKAKMTEAARQAFAEQMRRREQVELARWVYTSDFRELMMQS